MDKAHWLLGALDNRRDSWLEPVEFHGLTDNIPWLGKEDSGVEMKCRKNRSLKEDIIFGTLGILRCTVECEMRSVRYGTQVPNGYFGGGGTGAVSGSVAGAAVSLFSDLLLNL